jgi:glucokinase
MVPSGKNRFVLAGDIGGTKTILGIFGRIDEKLFPAVVKLYSSRGASSLEEIIEQFLNDNSYPVSSACLGVCGPVSGQRSEITNLPWTVSARDISTGFDIDKVILVNDIVALAYSIPLLGSADLVVLNAERPDCMGTIGVIAPGTGLGTAFIVKVNGETVPVPSEGGHADFAARNEMEIDLLRYMLRGRSHVSVETLVSGQGLLSIYSWLRTRMGHSEPPWLQEKFRCEDPPTVISETALKEKDPVCEQSLETFVSILGSVAGNLALTGLTTGGIYLGGGICHKIVARLKSGGFMESFTAKGRFNKLLSDIPVNVIINDTAPLMGAACKAFML